MEDARLELLPWLPDLMDRVRQQLVALEETEPDRQKSLDAEVAQLDANIKGWLQSLGNPDLPAELRVAIEQEWKGAQARKRDIEQAGREQACRRTQAEQILDQDEVLSRVEHLAEVLAANNPTLGNLELSLHIDRIDCFADGKVAVRTCKLGALTGAVDLVAKAEGEEPTTPEILTAAPDGTGPRRRTRLRLDDDGNNRSQLQALADFAADPYRFGGLGEEWFWVDEFQIPVRTSWALENSAKVQARYDQLATQSGKKPSLNVLATEFGKSRPTISAALKIAQDGPANGRRRQKAELRNPGVDAKSMADEFARLYREEGLEIKEIAQRAGAHRNTVARILNAWFDQHDVKRGDGRERRWKLREQQDK